MVRLVADWPTIAPTRQPSNWNPADPGDPGYNWSALDGQVQKVVAHHLSPYIEVIGAPSWAQSGHAHGVPGTASRPNAREFADFVRAVARRYSGRFQSLPRVRYFEIWNEENLGTFLYPQLVRKKPVSPGLYRAMLNAAYTAVHRVHRDNVVISGGLAPFRDSTPATLKQNSDWGPMTFMRNLLCLSRSLKKTCNAKVSFDVWATHPYTSGGPTHKAYRADDVSLGNLHEMKKALDAARAHHTIRSHHGVGFWVTEFSWDSSPPDNEAVPARTLLQWVPEALYRMWSNGISNVTWFSVRDEPLTKSDYQSGLYYRGKTVAEDKPKPFLKAFRFPVVAIPTTGSGNFHVWGRTPWGEKATVIVEHFTFGRHERVARLKTDRYGIFEGDYQLGTLGYLTVKIVGGVRSAPYRLKPIPDKFYNPFGLTRRPDKPR